MTSVFFISQKYLVFLKIAWFGLLGSIGIVSFLGLFLLGGFLTKDFFSNSQTTIFFSLAVLNMFIAWLFPRYIIHVQRVRVSVNKAFRHKCVFFLILLRLLLFVSVVMLGFIASVLASANIMLPYLAMAGIGFLLNFPSLNKSITLFSQINYKIDS